MTSRLRRAATWLLDNLPVLVLAGIAAVASFAHIRATAIQHGQQGWMGDSTAVCIDLTCLMAARERQLDARLSRRARGPVSWPTIVLGSGIVLSLAANIAQAQPTPWGWVIAGTPSASFLVAVSMLERRTGQVRAARTDPKEAPAPPAHTTIQPSNRSAVTEPPAVSAPVFAGTGAGRYADAPQSRAEPADHPARPTAALRTILHAYHGPIAPTDLPGPDAAPFDPTPGHRRPEHQQAAEADVADGADGPGNELAHGEAAPAPQVTDEVAALRLSRQTRTALPVGIHLDEVTETITYPGTDASQQAPHESAEPPAREDLVAELADQIRAHGEGWTPNYPALEKRTGMKRRWCEYLVRDARTAAAQPRTPTQNGIRTDNPTRGRGLPT